MQKTLRTSIVLSQMFLCLFSMLSVQEVWGQCTNSSPFGTATINTSGAVVTISTCSFAGEYSTINGAVNGQTLRFTSSVATDLITIREGSPTGPVAGGGTAFGTTPLTFSNTFTGTLYAHWNTPGCGSQSTCRTTTVQCTSCSPPPAPSNDLCANAISIACGQTISATTVSATSDAVPTCVTALNSAPGVWYTFVGDGGTTTLSLCGSGYDTKIGAFTGSCGSFTCVTGNDDFCGLQSQITFATTAGTTYYVLVTGFGTASGAFTLARTCVAPDPCASITTLSCGASVSPSSTGTGAWSPGSCGFSTPGQEKVYSFTAGANGNHTLVVTATNSVFADYFYKAASGGCNSTGWTCIDDIVSPVSVSFGPLTAGTTYYILYDPESTSTTSHTFYIDCPAGAPPCVASPTSPTNGQSNICPSATQTLSWAASPTATDYDVYFGTTNPPPFVANTTALSYVASTPTNGTYFWQIRPRNPGGVASGCSVWSFTKNDNTPPTITCPANVMANNNPATACSAVVTYGAISANDNCSPPSIVLQSGLASGSTFPVGVSTVVYRATDGVGLTATCSFTVTVKDVTPPTITCPANVMKNNDPGTCSATATFPNATATDNCSVSSITQTMGLPSGAVFPVGVHTIVFKASDPAMNMSTCSFTVTIKDIEPPVVTCPAPLALPTDVAQCGRAVGWVGQATFTDNCGAFIIQNNSPGYFEVGTHIVTHTVIDVNGNPGTCAQTVTIFDLEVPGILCPGNIVVKTDDNDCVATVDFAASWYDNCPGSTISYSADPNTTFAPGFNTVIAYATDASGNVSTCAFQIRVDTREEVCNGLDDDCDGVTDEAEDWEKVAKALASDGGQQDQYGVDVDIHGDFAIVGSNQKLPNGQSLGAAYILRRTANGWVEVSKLLPSDVEPGDLFGASVSIHNGVAAVGAPLDDDPVGNEGAVYIFYRNPDEDWAFFKKIKAADADPADNFGVSVDLNGENLLVGANLDDESGANAGAAYVFGQHHGGMDNWGQVSKLLATTGAADDNMGGSVAIDGDYAVVGATGVDGVFQNRGAAYVFKRSQNSWSQIARMTAPQSTQNDNFGASVGISGPWAIVGADQNDMKGADAGAAFMFYKNLNGIFDSWGLRSVLLDYNGSAGDRYGSGVGIDGDYAVVSAKGDNPFGPGSGRGFVYVREGDNWILVDQLADGGGQANDNLGASAAISGRTIILGAPLDNNGNAADEGAAVIFEGVCADEQAQQPDDREAPVSATDVRCYPVPFSDVLNVEVRGITANDVQVTILNTLGQEVASLYRGAVENDMLFQWRPAANLGQGIYFLRLNADGKVTSKTITLAR